MTRAPLFPAALLLTTVALLGTEGHAQTTTWEFTAIADSSRELASFSVPSVNDSGQIAFIAVFDDVAEGQAVYRRGANGALTIIADTSGPIASFSGDPAMNANGLVTFTATLDDGSVSVFCGDGVALITIANTAANDLNSIDSKPFISDTDGVVVLRAVRSADGARVILTGTGGPLNTLIASTGGLYDPQDVAGINAAGAVAFEALNSTGAKGVYRTTDDGVVTPVAETSAGGFTAVEALDINNNGTVVLSTNTAGDVGSLAVETTGPLVVFAQTPTPFNSFSAASVAESGAVAFRGTLEFGRIGIFAGGTGLYEIAIGVNDPLLGSTVTAVDSGPQAVTNTGPFVFRAGRSNGTTGVYVAMPRASSGGGGGGGSIDGVSVAVLALGSWLRRRPLRGLSAGGSFSS